MHFDPDLKDLGDFLEETSGSVHGDGEVLSEQEVTWAVNGMKKEKCGG